MCGLLMLFVFFFFNDTATTEIYTLSLHDALPIYGWTVGGFAKGAGMMAPSMATMLVLLTTDALVEGDTADAALREATRSEEHTSELQSPCNLVCRLLLEKKKKKKNREDIVTPTER